MKKIIKVDKEGFYEYAIKDSFFTFGALGPAFDTSFMLHMQKFDGKGTQIYPPLFSIPSPVLCRMLQIPKQVRLS